MLKLTTDKHEASRGLSATAELLVLSSTSFWHNPNWANELCVEFYLYPTVITALNHLIKPELIRWDWIEYGVRSRFKLSCNLVCGNY